jgi:hypothetical protein
MWAVLGLAKATMTLWLLQSQTLGTFVLVKSISMLAINVLAAFATIGVAAFVALRRFVRQWAPCPKRLPWNRAAGPLAKSERGIPAHPGLDDATSRPRTHVVRRHGRNTLGHA